jgi:hypothetical protein
MSNNDPLSRRDFTRIAAAAAGLSMLGATDSVAQSVDAPPLRSEFLMDIILDTSTPQNLAPRRIVPLTGGTFEGPELRGVALPGGADWIRRRADGADELDVRVTLQTDDEQLIYMTYRGIIYTPQGGERYWRTTPLFETASEKYGWLNHTVAVGVGRPVPGKAAYWVYRIL